jgi:hypothetical protein
MLLVLQKKYVRMNIGIKYTIENLFYPSPSQPRYRKGPPGTGFPGSWVHENLAGKV